MAKFQVDSPNVTYGDRYIEADYDYCTARVESATDGRYKVTRVAIFHHATRTSEHACQTVNRSLQTALDCVSGRNVKFQNSV